MSMKLFCIAIVYKYTLDDGVYDDPNALLFDMLLVKSAFTI